MSEPIPLYIGIPLAGLCLAAIVFIGAFVVLLWKDRK